MTSPASVVIVSVGMATPVGLTAGETAASVRAGAMRFVESEICDRAQQPLKLAVVPDAGLPPLAPPVADPPGLTARERRLLLLASRPLRECLAPLAAREPIRVGLCLALPDATTRRPLDSGRLLRCLAVQCPGSFDPALSDASHVGRAGGLVALGQAVETVIRGQADFMVAGAADTYRDLYVLGTLDAERRVKSELNLDGFIPGEGAAFVLIATRAAAAARGLPALAGLSRVSVGFETGHLYSPDPYRGDGFAATLAGLVTAGAVDAPIQTVYSSMNGESHWAKEWGVGYARNRALFAPGHEMYHPADSFGDVGSACGPVQVALAALGIRASYRRAPALIYASSDRGPRAAVIVSAAGH